MNAGFGQAVLLGVNRFSQVLGVFVLVGAWNLLGWPNGEVWPLRADEQQKPFSPEPSSTQPQQPLKALMVQAASVGQPKSEQSQQVPQPPKPQAEDPYAWKELFDGKTLKGWKAPQFGGEGKVEVKDGQIILHAGETMTGIVYEGKVPTTNYELQLEGKRISGSDFFATTTFPVGDSHVSFVTGGWGGTVIGISCVDWRDASDNPTSAFREFKNNQWYKFRIRVTDARIQVWIDDDPVVDLPRKGYKFSTRAECDPCRPLGIASWCTTGAVRNIRIRQLKPEEVKQAAEEP